MSAGTPGEGPAAARFEAFVRAHQDMVFATAVRLLGRPADAEDVAQEVFLRAYEHFETLGDSPTAAGWLRTVTRNVCLNQLTRYRWRWRLFSELGRRGDDEDPPLQALAPAAAGGERDDEQLDRLEQALQALPDAQRIPIVLFHFEAVSYQDIAQMLGISLGKVKTDIHRGRERLKLILTRDGTR